MNEPLQTVRTSAAPLALGDPGDRAEREADTVTAHLSQPLLPTVDAFRPVVSREAQPAMRRWKIGGNMATSDDESDTLGGLAPRVGAHFNHCKCIKPISQRTSTFTPKDFFWKTIRGKL
jgi:hypothetical protein